MHSPTPAWLFDVYPDLHQSRLIVWVKHGSRTVRLTVPYRPAFCLRAEAEPLDTAEALLRKDARVESFMRVKRQLWLRAPAEEVLEVRPWNLHQIIPVATELRRKTHTKGLLFFDVDHQPESRWMHANGLFAMCRLRMSGSQPVLALAEGEDRWGLSYPTPELRSLRLEVKAEQRAHEPSYDDPLL